MKIKRTINEIINSDYYKLKPIESIKYIYSKYYFSKNRILNSNEFLNILGIDSSILDSYKYNWQDIIEGNINECTDTHVGVPIEVGKVLYGIVRFYKPQILIETGIAAGISTTFILAGLLENKSGMLYSIDLPPNSYEEKAKDGSNYTCNNKGIGWVIPDIIIEQSKNIHKIILNDVKVSLPKLLNENQKIDFFLHDDLHLPNHMKWEYDLVWDYINQGGILCSDDINYGWKEFICEKNISFGKRNIDRFGLVIKS